MAERYDVIIIGAGQSGGPLSTALAKAGRRVALIEREHVGGTCVNTGCTPTKTMIASARVAHLARRAADYGVSTGPVSVNLGVVRQRKRVMVERFRSGSQQQIEQTDGVDLMMGEAQFTAPKQLAVRLNTGATRSLTADTVIINVGARPALPPVEGLDRVPSLDSTTIMELDSVPEHLLVMGGGYIGLEFAQMFRRFGSDVTVIQRDDQLLPHEDPDIAEAVADILRDDDITVLTSAEVQRVEQIDNVTLQVSVQVGGETCIVAGSHLLVATGRQPNSDVLNVAAAGLNTDKQGHILVDEYLETNVPGVYAMGDVKGGPAFTHISYDDFRMLKATLIEGKRASIAGRLVPYTVFIDPQLGRVGLTEQEARKQGYRIQIARLPMKYVARALETDETRGVMKAVIDAQTDQILGAAILGLEGGEVVTVIQTAMMGRLPYTALRDAAFSHPTLAESLNNLFSSLEA
ncbi:MAG: mercuric reductase [Chloroflexaceae bacterium]|nr:mercuric reductase [Chloroflexaceae bacterium]